MFIPSESYNHSFAFSTTLQLLPPCALRLSLPLSSHELSSCEHWFAGRSVQPIPQVLGYIYISCEVARHLPPHRESGQRVRLSGTASHSLSPQQQRCQRCGCRKYCILLWNLFVTEASPRQTVNKYCFFGPLTVTHLANLSDHVWFAACVSQ